MNDAAHPMLLLLTILLCCALSARLLVERLLPGGDVADRAAAWVLLGFALFLGVPIQVGLVSNSLALGKILGAQVGVLGVVAAASVVLARRRGGSAFGESVLRAWWHDARAAHWPSRLLWGAAAACVALSTLPGWFLPPRFVDAIEYHVLQPLQWLQTGTFELGLRRPWDLSPAWWWGETYPNLKSLWVVQWVQARGSFAGSGMIGGAYAGVWLVALWALGRRMNVAGWAMGAAALAIATMPDVILQSTELYADVQAAAAVAFAVWALTGLAERGEPPRRWVWLAAVAVGHLAAVKASTLLAAALLGLVVVVLTWRRGTGRRERLMGITMAAAACSLIGIALAGAWVGRNVVVYGNPLYPIRLGPLSGVVDPGITLSGIAREGRSRWFFAWRAPFETIGVTHLGNRLAGVGAAGVGLMLPAVIAVAWWARRTRNRQWGFQGLLLALLLVGVPELWWPRFQLTLATSGALALAWLLGTGGRASRAALLALLFVSVAWNSARAIPAVLGWPRPPMLAAYPFVTGDTQAEALGRPPDAYTARDFVREELAADHDTWVAHVAKEYTPYWIAGPFEPRRSVMIPLVEDAESPALWIETLRRSRATHVVAYDGWEESLLLDSRPDLFERIWLDQRWPGEHIWYPGEHQPLAVWRVLR